MTDIKALQSKIIMLFVAILFSSVAYFFVSESTDDFTETNSEAIDCHSNSNKNNKLHKVYEIYKQDAWGVRFTLKYGITSQNDFVTKKGNPRTEYQVAIFRKLPEYRNFQIDYTILDSIIEGRLLAKQIELQYVNDFFTKFQTMPERQLRPLPDDNF